METVQLKKKLTYGYINLDLFDFQLLILSYDTFCYQTFLDIYVPLFYIALFLDFLYG